MSLEPFTCPNCGAPLKGLRCEYCGTEFFYQKDQSDLIQVKLHLFDEQRRMNDLYESAIKAFRHYHF